MSYSVRLVLSLSLGFVSLLAGGCGAGAVLGGLGISSLGGDDDGGARPAVPRVVNLQVLGNPRADDLSRVRIAFDLVETTREKAAVSLEYSSDDFATAALPVVVSESTAELAASTKGERHVVTWDARVAGLSGFQLISLRVTPVDKDGEGITATLSNVPVGNEPPIVRDLRIEFPEKADAVSQNIVIKYRLEDRAGDPTSIEVSVSTEGMGEDDFTPIPEEDILLGNISGLLPGEHGLTWDSRATLGALDIGVHVAIRPDDGLSDGAGALAISELVRVDNNSPPEVDVVEPVGNPDGDGPIQLTFLLRDAESDPADVVLQWSTEEDFFPDISEASDPERRRSILVDPDERVQRQIVTPRLRIMVEGRCRGADADGSEVPLAEITPPTGITTEKFRGATLEILSATGAVEQTRRIVLADPARRRFLLETPLDPPPRPGQPVRVRESVEQLLLDLRTSRTGRGARHHLAWDVTADSRSSPGNATYFVRALSFKGGKAGSGSSDTTLLEKPIRTRRSSLSTEPFVIAVPGALRLGALAAADADDDGSLDLLAADTASRRVFVLLAEGNGTFQPAPPLPTGREPIALATGDVDGDGVLDVISADNLSSQLSVFTGNGDGTFRDPVRLPTGQRPASVIATDLDRNGFLDLASADTDANQVSLFLNPGTGALEFERGSLPASSPVSVFARDLDADGNTDLVIGERTRLSIHYGAGDGTFPRRSILRSGLTPGSVAAADLDADGHLDLVSSDRGSEQLSVFLADGNGGFEEPSTLTTGASPGSVAIGDANGDGHLDLISVPNKEARVKVFPGNGDGTFGEFFALESETPPVDVLAQDLNEDRHLDLVATLEREVWIYSGETERLTFATPSRVSTRATMSTVSADVDGDGDLDLVSGDSQRNGLAVFLGDGAGTFVESASLPTRGAPQSIVSADLNGDGHLDLVTADGVLFVFLGDSSGNFVGQSLVGTNQALSVLALDVNEDDRLDLLTNGRVFLGEGDGTFRATLVIPKDEDPILAADLNEDGHQDVIFSDATALLGDGVRFPAIPITLPAAARLAVDLDEDGHLDLVVTDSIREQLLVFPGDGSGRFRRTPDLIGVGRDPGFVLAVDLDGDGHTDLVSGDLLSQTFGPDQLSVFLGEGDGHFAEAFLFPVQGRLRSILASDLNGDGDVDLVTSEFVSNQLSVYFNTSLFGHRPLSFGHPRVPSPTTGNGRGADLVLSKRRHRINTSLGTIDGVRSDAFEGRSFHFDSIVVEEGAAVEVTGEFPLALLARGDVVIAGSLICDGSAARDAGSIPGRSRGTAGGPGGPSGGAGGDGGGTSPGSGEVRGRRGSGPGGGYGGRVTSNGATSGAGGGHATDGADTADTAGGGTYGNPRMQPVFGGSGGGGGGIADGTFGPRGELNAGDPAGNGGDFGGGGGGGGGGALRITAGGDIIVEGSITADGGDGGRGNADRGGNGGGGAGGSILLQSYDRVFLGPQAVLSATGGNGATSDASPPGGDGGEGRIRLEDSDGVIEGWAAATPEPVVGRLDRR